MFFAWWKGNTNTSKKLSLYESSFYKDDSGVLWLNESDSRYYQIYRFNSHRDIIDIPQIELLNAIRESLSEQVAIDEDSLTLIAAKNLVLCDVE